MAMYGRLKCRFFSVYFRAREFIASIMLVMRKYLHLFRADSKSGSNITFTRSWEEVNGKLWETHFALKYCSAEGKRSEAYETNVFCRRSSLLGMDVSGLDLLISPPIKLPAHCSFPCMNTERSVYRRTRHALFQSTKPPYPPPPPINICSCRG